MTGMISSQGGLTRRSFLKGTAVAAGAVGIVGAGSMISADGWLAPVKAQAAPEERTAYTTIKSIAVAAVRSSARCETDVWSWCNPMMWAKICIGPSV